MKREKCGKSRDVAVATFSLYNNALLPPVGISYHRREKGKKKDRRRTTFNFPELIIVAPSFPHRDAFFCVIKPRLYNIFLLPTTLDIATNFVTNAYLNFFSWLRCNSSSVFCPPPPNPVSPKRVGLVLHNCHHPTPPPPPPTVA